MEKDATTSTLFGVNQFSKAFAEFDEEAFFDNLHNQVRNKSYFEKYKGFKTTLLCLSYVFNMASALTASYAVYWFINWITGMAIVGYIVAGVALFFLEQIKRKSSTEFWQVFFFRKQMALGWLMLSLFCLGASLASSGFGVKQGAEELAPDPELLQADSMVTYYTTEIAKLEAENEELRANKNSEGVTFYRLYGSINLNTATIADYRKKKMELEEKIEGKNELLTESYMEEVKLTAWTLVWITLIMELLFEACIAYIWYYFHRSYVERNVTTKGAQSAHNGTTKGARSTHNESPSPTPSGETENLLKLIEQLQADKQKLEAQIASTSTPPEPKREHNGTPVAKAMNPIGFFPRGHTRTREDTQVIDDRYTVPHTYRKGGEDITVHYNATMIKSRVGEYERKIDEAEARSMGESVLENRRKWLNYWKGKQNELAQKLEASTVA